MGIKELSECASMHIAASSTDLSLVPLGGDMIEVVSPFQESTTAGRLLSKRGDGGYMIIMQTEDAKKRRDHIEAEGLAKVIFSQEHDDIILVQYHPKGIKGVFAPMSSEMILTMLGGMMPELDSHAPSSNNPTPLKSRLSPWHACGPDYEFYHAGMKRSEHLTLQGCVLRLKPGDYGHEAASREWEEMFGVVRSRDLLAFTNARVGFVPGEKGQPEGLVSITVGVKGKDKLEAIRKRATEVGVRSEQGIEMCGVQWKFTLTGHDGPRL